MKKTILLLILTFANIGLVVLNVTLFAHNFSPSSVVAPNHTQNPPNTVTPSEAKNTACEFIEWEEGAWQNNLELARLDQETGKLESQEILVERAGVPSLIEDKEGRLILVFQWFPCEEDDFDKIAIIFSEDQGETWSEPEVVEIEGLPKTQRAFDPTLVALEDGQFRLYFTVGKIGNPTQGDLMKIYSAISDDALHYSMEEGVRLGDKSQSLFDATVTYFDGMWHMIVPKNENGPTGRAYHATSEDGLDFELQDDIQLDDENLNWTGNLFVQNDRLYFYGTPVWYTSTKDGEDWAKGKHLEEVQLGDPSFLCTEDEQCMVVGVKW